MTSTILGVSVAVVVTWVLAYVVDLAGVLPDPDEDMIRDVVLKPHRKKGIRHLVSLSITNLSRFS